MIKLKKGHFKKLTAFILTLSIAASLPAAAFAAESDIIDKNKDTSLTIYKYDEDAARAAGVQVDGLIANGLRNETAESKLAKYAIKGVEFTYLKVSDIKTKTEGNVIHLVYTIPSKLENILGLSATDHTYTSEQLADALDNALTDNTVTKDKLEDYILSSGGTKMAKTDDKGMTASKHMSQGLYLVVETQVPRTVNTTVNPFLVSLPMTDAEGDYWFYDIYVYPKNQTNLPTIDKVVSEEKPFDDIASVSEGDTASFRIVSKLPKITSKATYLEKYVFVDKICYGLDYKKDVTVEFYENENSAKQGEGAPLASWNEESGYFSTSYKDNNKTMTVAITKEGLGQINNKMSNAYIVICYSADVDSSDKVVLGDDGNSNQVELTYKRTSEEEETIKDRAVVYSYGIDLTKKFQGKEGDPKLVQFVLKNVTDGYYITAKGDNGSYYVTDSQKALKEKEATVFSPDSNGKLVINGLEADMYELMEIKTAPGFILLKQPITIIFSQTIDVITPSVAAMTGHDNPNKEIITVNLDRASSLVDGESAEMEAFNTSVNARVKLEVINNRGFNVPYTGGKGRTLINIAGIVAVVLGLCMAKRKDEETSN